MDALWSACLTAVAVMFGVPLLAAVLGLCGRALLRVLRRPRRGGEVLQLTLPLHRNEPRKLSRLRTSLGLHG
jgi:hypothetical protein